MAYASPTVQGRFTQPATAINQVISIPSGFDWVKTYNLTQIAAAGAGVLEAYFQVGMPNGQGIAWSNSGALTLTQLAAGTGFFYYDSSNMANSVQAAMALTNTTGATNPVISVASTATIFPGSIVRLFNVSSGHSVDGLDFIVDSVPNGTTFRLGGIFGTAPFANGAATGSVRVVNYNSGPWAPWYPPYRAIINITTGTSTVITLNVPSNYQVGQEVVFSIPFGYGTTELDGLTGTVTAVTNGNASPSITVNIDSTGFTAFTFLNSYSLKNRAIVAPVGADTAYILNQNPVGNILNDAVYNTQVKGVLLTAGANSPAGVAADQIYWIAGKSANVSNS